MELDIETGPLISSGYWSHEIETARLKDGL